MAHLIDKDAVLAEIERRRNICKKVILDLRSHENKDYYQGKAEAYKDILDTLDTHEVKEVDLEKEIEVWEDSFKHWPASMGYKETAKHFFELGLSVSNKAQKGE